MTERWKADGPERHASGNREGSRETGDLGFDPPELQTGDEAGERRRRYPLSRIVSWARLRRYAHQPIRRAKDRHHDPHCGDDPHHVGEYAHAVMYASELRRTMALLREGSDQCALNLVEPLSEYGKTRLLDLAVCRGGFFVSSDASILLAPACGGAGSRTPVR